MHQRLPLFDCGHVRKSFLSLGEFTRHVSSRAALLDIFETMCRGAFLAKRAAIGGSLRKCLSSALSQSLSGL
jgi:hypothetical protein